MENFINSIVIPGNLPVIEKETFNKLEKKYLTIILIRILIFFLVLSGAFISILFISEELPPVKIILLISSAIIVLIAYSFIINLLGFPKKGYLVRDKDISFQRGLITYKITTVPFNRIQHVEVNQGILAKMLKLSTVKIFTAGGNASDLSIPGLQVDIANNLKS
ncbi:MAG: PH domain-containing protein, partial [Mariniphaga sp.]|nr:PH domain-containing protein [Mariniphaga sp.]